MSSTNDYTVSVIIPTYNRAHLLEKTIPSYIQRGVKEVILVDDCSTDNTSVVVNRLHDIYPQVIYKKAPRKVLQVGAKNIGMDIATGDFFYFGDDDSILKPGSIQSLLNICLNNPYSLVGARHHYMKEDEDLDELLKDEVTYDIKDLEKFLDKKSIKIDSYHKYDCVAEVPFCQACFMLPAATARQQKFYEGYVGTCNREETDYIMQVCQNFGYKVLLDNESLSIDLPRSVSSGGIRSVKKIKRIILEIKNEYNFWRRNRRYLCSITPLTTNPSVRAISFALRKIIR